MSTTPKNRSPLRFDLAQRRTWIAILVLMSGAGILLLANRPGQAGTSANGISPCELLTSRLTTTSDAITVADSLGLATDIKVPIDLGGTFLCWDHHDDAGFGAIDGIAVTDLATERIWLIVANDAMDDIEWELFLSDNGFRGLLPTAYGFSNGDSFTEGMNFWEKSKQVISR